MRSGRRTIVLLQLPIPPLGPQPIRGNVPLAAGYLKLFAQTCGLEEFYDIAILPTWDANNLNDRALVDAILAYEPWLVGFTCYLWNIDRTLWIADRLKEHRPELRIVLGGPEVTADNAWVLQAPAVNYAVIGEGEQTFAELLLALAHEQAPLQIDGLVCRPGRTEFANAGAYHLPPAHSLLRPRKPMPNLNAVSSPYLAGILDAAEEQMLLLETIRGCVFKCKFCYYPKSYDGLYFLAEDRILANLQHAAERGAREVVLLDPTLNQRRDFADFLRLLIRGNPERRFTYFGELRAEGITPEIAGLLRKANFTEVEVGLQSIEPQTQSLMDRKNNLRAVERGIHAMRAVGIRVKVDLIVGLPGDTVASVRRGMHYLRDQGLYDDVQMFNLAILPGTAFRHEAEQLGLRYQPRPPYYLLETPTLRRPEIFGLMQEAEDVFGIDWDPLPPADLGMLEGDESGPEGISSASQRRLEPRAAIRRCWQVNLDEHHSMPQTDRRAQAFTLWLQSSAFHRHISPAAGLIRDLLRENPFTTLQVIVEPRGDAGELMPTDLQELMTACQERPTYLDRFYALQPGRPIGAKRLIVLLPGTQRSRLGSAWCEAIGEFATIVWNGPQPPDCGLREHEFVMPQLLG